MDKLTELQKRLQEVEGIYDKMMEPGNNRVYIRLSDFQDKKYYLYCSKEIWNRVLHLKTEGKQFVELTRSEYEEILKKNITV